MRTSRIALFRHAKPVREAIQFLLVPKRLSLLLVFAVLYVPFLFHYGWGYRDIPNNDLPSFYSASVEVFRHGESPYEQERLRSLMGGQMRVHPYLYPPPSLLLFYPLSLLDYDSARPVVLGMNHLILLALLWVIPWRLLRDASGRDRSFAFILTFVYLLTFRPTVTTLDHGQVNLLLLAFLLVFWLLAKASRPVSASLFLALAILLKTYPLVILPMLFVTGRRRECGYTGAWIGLGVVLSLLLLPSGIWHDWLVNVLPTGAYAQAPGGAFSPAAIWNQSLNGLFARALTESYWSSPAVVNADLARNLTYAAAGLVAAISGVAAWRGSRIQTNDLDRTMLVALPAMYLVAPLSWEHHLVYLQPAVLVLLTARTRLPIPAAVLFYALAVGAALLIGMDVDALLGLKVYAVAVIWALCGFTACSRGIHLSNDGTTDVAALPLDL